MELAANAISPVRADKMYKLLNRRWENVPFPTELGWHDVTVELGASDMNIILVEFGCDHVVTLTGSFAICFSIYNLAGSSPRGAAARA